MILTNSLLFDALSATPVLVGLNDAALELLAREGIVRDFVPGDAIVREGEEGHSLFIMAEGDVEVIKNQGGVHEAKLATLRSRTFFGEMCVVDPVPRAATVVALTNVKAIEIKAATLYHLFQQMPAQYSVVILNLARDMARRLRSLDEAFAARTS